MPTKDMAAYMRKKREAEREAEGREKQAGGSKTEKELKDLLAVNAYGQRRPLFPSGAIPADPIYGDHRPSVEHLEGVGVQLSTKKIGRHEEVPFFSTLNPHFNSKAVVMSIYSPDPEDPTRLMFSIICGAESAVTFGVAMSLLDKNPSDPGAPDRVSISVRNALFNVGTAGFWPGTQYRTHFRRASDFDVKPPTLDTWARSEIQSGASAGDGAEAEDDDEAGSLTVPGSRGGSVVVAAAPRSSQPLITSFRSKRPAANGPSEIVDLSDIVEHRQGFQSVIDDHFPRPERGSAIKANALFAAVAETVDLTASDDEEENPVGGEYEEDDDDDDEEDEDEEDPPMKKRRV